MAEETEPTSNPQPALKRILHDLINVVPMTLEKKQELYDLVTTHFGNHDDDPTRPGTIGTNPQGDAPTEVDPKDVQIANLRRELDSLRASQESTVADEPAPKPSKTAKAADAS